MNAAWRWAGACAVGTSHVARNLECQDRASCVVMPTLAGEVLIAVVSDGAGSAREASRGAYIVCSEFSRRIRAFTREDGRLPDLSREDVADWLDAVRERISVTAKAKDLRPRDYAATLVAIIATDTHAAVIHVGDGAVVVRDSATQAWSVPSWPAHGEYASMTNFVIDDPQPVVELVHLASSIDRFAVFSDGMENLVLDFKAKSAPASYYEEMMPPLLASDECGRSRRLSRHLRGYLQSEKICELTDDDKTLILGARIWR